MNGFTSKELTLIRFMAKDTARNLEKTDLPKESINDYYVIADKCSEIKQEESKEKKLLNILKEKKVDLDRIRHLGEQLKWKINSVLEAYNIRYTHHPEQYVRDTTRILTLEEMQLIVNWLKETKCE